MNTWSLDALFTSFESPEYIQAHRALNDLLTTALAWESLEVEPALKVSKGLDLIRTFRTLSVRVGAFINLTLATDTQNEKALKEMQKVQVLAAQMSPFSTAFESYVASQDIAALETHPDLKPFAFYLSQTKKSASYLLSSQEEQLLAELSPTGGSAWSRLHSVLTSTLMIPYEGSEKSLPEIRNLAYNKDQAVRKNAYEAELKAYEKIDESVAASLNAIKGQVNTLSRKRGYASPLAQATEYSRMQESTLEALLTAMQDHFPKFRTYLQRKASLLGHAGALPWYDLFAPMGESSTTFSEADAIAYIETQFNQFSTELGAMARKAYTDEWIDFSPRKGKRGGAFCSNLHPIKASRILMNFEGTFSNVITLAHELGHAYHGEQIFKEDILNASYTMPVAETASTLCETIVKRAAIEDATGAEKIFLLEQSIMGSTQVIVDIFSRFHFEKSVFEERLNGPLSVKRLKELMEEGQTLAYGTAIHDDVKHPYMWVNKPHYYSPGLSFYNFPYAFGLLFAKGIYATYQEKGAPFVDAINTLLQKTGQMTVEDVAKLIAIDVQDVAFWHASLGVIEAEIDQFLDLTV